MDPKTNDPQNALEFCEKSSKEAAYFNPSSFCLLFYRSFYLITFEKAGAERDCPCKIVEEIREESEHRDKLSDILTVLSYLEPCIGSQLQNATTPTTDKLRSDGQPSQKTGHSTTVFAGAGSNVTVTQTETENGDVTVNTAVTEESQPDKQPDRSSKRTAIEISADIAVHVLVYTVLHHFAEDLMPVIAPILVLSALIILLLIIRNAKSR